MNQNLILMKVHKLQPRELKLKSNNNNSSLPALNLDSKSNAQVKSNESEKFSNPSILYGAICIL